MLELKVDQVLEEAEKIEKKIEKIDTAKILKDAVNSCLDKGNIKKMSDNKEELLDLLYDKIIKNYLDFIKTNSLKTAGERVKKELEDNKKSIKSILIKSENQIKEYKNKYLNILEENKNLQDKIYTMQNYNRQLLSQIKTYQLNLEKLQQSYKIISKQKSLFEEIIKAYPGKSPTDIIKELSNMKEGIMQMMGDYQNISMKLYEAKEHQKKLEEEYKLNFQKLTFENQTLKEEKNSIDYKYYDKINTLEQNIYDNEGKIKENQYLKNVIFHIYNLLFKEFALNRNIKIDKKYLDVKESDFNANFLYDNEIKNYIQLMIQTMNPITYDIVFRETLGYLNMILRIYLPNKLNLRFQPVKAFKEIKDFIDIKMEKIENNQKMIEKYKRDIENRDNEIFLLKQEIDAINKEYNSYKIIVEKEFSKTNRIIFQLQNNKGRNNLQNMPFNKKYIEKSPKNDKFIFDISENEGTNNSKYKLKSAIPFKIKKKKSKSLNTRFISIKNIENKNNINNKTDILNSNKVCKTLENAKTKDKIYKEFLGLKNSVNKDKIIIENGNQEFIDNFNNIKFLINETNRLFLYQPKMNSTQNKIFKRDKHNMFKTRVIRDYNDLKVNESENIKKKICQQINSLIASSNK